MLDKIPHDNSETYFGRKNQNIFSTTLREIAEKHYRVFTILVTTYDTSKKKSFHILSFDIFSEIDSVVRDISAESKYDNCL